MKWELDVLVNIYSNMKRMTYAIEESEKKADYEKLLDRTAALILSRSDKGDLESNDLSLLAMLDLIIREEYEAELAKEDFFEKLFYCYIPWEFFSFFVGALLYLGIFELIKSRKRAINHAQ